MGGSCSQPLSARVQRLRKAQPLTCPTRLGTTPGMACSLLPGKVLRVQYEDVVADLDGQVRRMLEHCGLPFEEACLNYHETDRSVRTPSSEQVRQPIYKSGLEPWRPFEPFLEPLKDALGPVLDRYPVTPAG